MGGFGLKMEVADSWTVRGKLMSLRFGVRVTRNCKKHIILSRVKRGFD